MEKNVLNDFETFEEFPDSYLCIKANSPYYFIRKPLEDIIARKNVDSVSNTEGSVITEESFYNVKDGKLVLKRKKISNINDLKSEIIEYSEKAKVISLSSIFNLKGDKEYHLTSEDIQVLLTYKEASSKRYNLAPRKYYF